jgi:hypothetical protein
MRDLDKICETVEEDCMTWIERYDGPPFDLVVIDSRNDVPLRAGEVKLIHKKKMAGMVLVHDTSRLRGSYSKDGQLPGLLDKLKLPSVENPFSRGWRLFDLRR